MKKLSPPRIPRRLKNDSPPPPPRKNQSCARHQAVRGQSHSGDACWVLIWMGRNTCLEQERLWSAVPQTSLAAVSRVSQPADHSPTGRPAACGSQPAAQTFLSAVPPTFQSVQRRQGNGRRNHPGVRRAGMPAIRQTGMSALRRTASRLLNRAITAMQFRRRTLRSAAGTAQCAVITTRRRCAERPAGDRGTVTQGNWPDGHRSRLWPGP
jgi:hypothetical protein